MSMPPDNNIGQEPSRGGRDPTRKRKLTILIILLAILPVVWVLALAGPSTIVNLFAPGSPPDATGISADVPPTEEEIWDFLGRPPADEEEELPAVAAVEELMDEVRAGLQRESVVSPETLSNPFATPGEATPNDRPGEETSPPDSRPTERLGETRARLRRELSLTGIIYSEQEPLALINGRAVREKDQVGEGMYVSKITPSSVTISLTDRETDHELTLELKGVR